MDQSLRDFLHRSRCERALEPGKDHINKAPYKISRDARLNYRRFERGDFAERDEAILFINVVRTARGTAQFAQRFANFGALIVGN